MHYSDFFSRKPIIIVGGMGRCGTSLIMNAIKESANYRKHRWITDIEPAKFKRNIVYKTHDFAPRKTYPENFKFIYLFGNPMDIICSCVRKGDDFLRKHYKHMHADYSNHRRWMEEDTLFLRDNCISWYKEQKFHLLTLRYESMFENVEILESFLGMTIHLPPKKERTLSWKDFDKEGKVEHTYNELSTLIDSADNAKIWPTYSS